MASQPISTTLLCSTESILIICDFTRQKPNLSAGRSWNTQDDQGTPWNALEYKHQKSPEQRWEQPRASQGMFAQQNQRAQTSTGSSGGLLQKVVATTDHLTVGRCHRWTNISTYRHRPVSGKMCMQQFCMLCRGEELQNKCDTLQCGIWDLIWWGVMQEGVAANANFMRPILAQVLLSSSCCCLIIIHSDGFAPMPPTKSV